MYTDYNKHVRDNALPYPTLSFSPYCICVLTRETIPLNSLQTDTHIHAQERKDKDSAVAASPSEPAAVIFKHSLPFLHVCRGESFRSHRQEALFAIYIPLVSVVLFVCSLLGFRLDAGAARELYIHIYMYMYGRTHVICA